MALFKGKRPQGFGLQITLKGHAVIWKNMNFSIVQYFHEIMFLVLLKGKCKGESSHVH